MLQNLGIVDLVLALGFLIGLALFFDGFRIYRELRLVADTPVIPILGIPMGLVHICGKARGDERVPSPVFHTPCYFYKVEIEIWKDPIFEDRGRWALDQTDTGGVKFFLEDASGKVLVDAREAEYDLEDSDEREIGPHAIRGPGTGATKKELLRYLNSLAVKKANSALQSDIAATLSIEEKTVRKMGPQSDPEKEKKRLAALEAFKYPAGSAEFAERFRRFLEFDHTPEEAQKLVALMQAPQQPQEVSLEDINSLASERYRFTEYCILPEHEYNITGTCVENPEAKDEHERNLVMKGLNEPTFLISCGTEKGIEKGLRRRAVYEVIYGAALAIGCLFLFLNGMGLL